MSFGSPQRSAEVARRLSGQSAAVPASPAAGVAIVGPPGAGKTTRLVALARAYRYSDPSRVVVCVCRRRELLEILTSAGAVQRMVDLRDDPALLAATVDAGIDTGIVADDEAAWRHAATAAARLRSDPARRLLLLLDDAEAASAETAAALAARSERTALLLAWRPTGRVTDAWLLDLVGTTIVLGGWTREDHAVLRELGLVERASWAAPSEPTLTSPQWQSLVQSAAEHAWDATTVRELIAHARELLSLPSGRTQFDHSADWVRLHHELG